ncbi:MAG: dihydrodipicolinate synthase family protein [Christensenellales bacterium]
MKSGIQFPGGVWPVMLTPYTKNNKIDYQSLEKLVNWYIEKGVSGLFAVCQSSEMFFLSVEERVSIARYIVDVADSRVPVIASGHVSDSMEEQIDEVNRMASTGIDAAILITNRLAEKDHNDDIWLKNLDILLHHINSEIPLGFYECPYPYKRVLNLDVIKELLKIDRFYFLKDTCCNLEDILAKQTLVEGSKLRIYNANTATLLPALRAGITGYSGVMANFHPELYVWLCTHIHHRKAETLQELLSMAALIERQVYPVNAKYFLQVSGILNDIFSRSKDGSLFDETAKSEVQQLMSLSQKILEWLHQ